MKSIESLYIHFPWCEHICNYCDFYKNVLPENQRNNELSQLELHFNKMYEKNSKLLTAHSFIMNELKTIFIGGGTPSLWGSEGAKFIASLIKDNKISFLPDHEFTIELNPNNTKFSDLDSWEKAGVNRYSVGMQSFDSRFIKILDRIHTIDMGQKLFTELAKNKKNYSIDLMLGLPYSEKLQRDIVSELQQMLEFEPKHISMYILTVKDNYIHNKELPGEEYIEEEYLKASEFLTSAGYQHYEVSNFSLPGKECLHNMKYWNSESVAAIGPSATGYLLKNKNNAIRYKWKNKLLDYELENLNQEEVELEKDYLSFRTSKGLSLTSPKTIKLARSWQDRSMGHFSHNKFCLNSKGYLVLDSLINEYFSVISNT